MNFLSFKQARQTIKLVANAGRKIDERIHLIGCSGLHHYVESGDTVIITELVHAMPKSSRGKALKYWVTKNANVKWESKSHGGKGGFIKAKKGDAPWASVEEAIAKPFWDKPEDGPSEFKGYSREAEVANFIARMKKKEEKFDDLSDKDREKVSYDVNDETIQTLLSLCNFDAIIDDKSDDNDDNAGDKAA